MKIFKDLILTVGLPITSFTVSGDIEKKKSSENIKKKKKKKLWKWPVNWSFSELFYFFYFVPPTLNLKKNSRKSTNKKNSGHRILHDTSIIHQLYKSMNVRFYLSHDIKITVKCHFLRKKNAIMYAMLLWTSFYNVTEICKPLVVYWF